MTGGEWPVSVRPPTREGGLWFASVKGEDEDGLFGWMMYAEGVDELQAVMMLEKTVLAFFENLEANTTVHLVVGGENPAPSSSPVRLPVYPPSVIFGEVEAALFSKIRGLRIAEAQALDAQNRGLRFDSPINVELTEHEIAEGLKALGDDGRRVFLARIGRFLIDEPALKDGGGLLDIMLLASWIEDRFGFKP